MRANHVGIDPIFIQYIIINFLGCRVETQRTKCEHRNYLPVRPRGAGNSIAVYSKVGVEFKVGSPYKLVYLLHVSDQWNARSQTRPTTRISVVECELGGHLSVPRLCG
jgi:hypothetical protein